MSRLPHKKKERGAAATLDPYAAIGKTCPGGPTYLNTDQSAERNRRVMRIPISWTNRRNASDQLRVVLLVSSYEPEHVLPIVS
eukprot:8465111-Pyramimonas_sp.AAC.2